MTLKLKLKKLCQKTQHANCWKYEIVSLSIPKVPGYILSSAGRLSGLKFLLIFMFSSRQLMVNIRNFNVDWKKI